MTAWFGNWHDKAVIWFDMTIEQLMTSWARWWQVTIWWQVDVSDRLITMTSQLIESVLTASRVWQSWGLDSSTLSQLDLRRPSWVLDFELVLFLSVGADVIAKIEVFHVQYINKFTIQILCPLVLCCLLWFSDLVDDMIIVYNLLVDGWLCNNDVSGSNIYWWTLLINKSWKRI